MTRPEPASARFLSDLAARLGRPVPALVSPVLRIVPVGSAPRAAMDEEIVVTSANAAPALTKLSGRTAHCVGARSAEAARNAGLSVATVARDVAGLIERLAGDGAPLLYLRGKHVTRSLTVPGRLVRDVVVYDQLAVSLNDEAAARLTVATPLICPLFSVRSSRLLATETDGSVAPLVVVALSDAVAAAWERPVHGVAATPDGQGMLSAVADTLESYGVGSTRPTV